MTTAKVIQVTTDLTGYASVDARLYGRVEAIAVRLGSLENPEVLVTDDLTGLILLDHVRVPENRAFLVRVQTQTVDGSDLPGAYDCPAVTGLLKVSIADGGPRKSGEIVVVYG